MPQTDAIQDNQGAEATENMATVGDLSDQDIMIRYCLESKINKTAIDELLKRGFDSLNALRLVNIEDLSSQNIPMGQRRLIFHIAQALNNETTSGQLGSSMTSSGGNRGISQPASVPLQQPESQDVYNQTLFNTLLQQQTQLSAASATSGVNVSTGGVNVSRTESIAHGPQPSWSDPQIHIASATGKSASTFHDICDFVPHSIEEDVVVGGEGEQKLIKSGPKKPRLESLTLSQWSVANLSILYKLVNEGKLLGPSLMDYLSYTTKVYQLVQRFSLTSVLLYDREYRKLQATMNFRWGTDVQHLHTLFLQPRPNSGTQGNPTNVQKKGNINQSASSKPRLDRRIDICRNYNSDKGCSYDQCRYKHKCILPGCGQAHSA
ncbi:MAG: hypothetical protein AB2541_04815, partial [Candidatus Thiodiazotropha sp.]